MKHLARVSPRDLPFFFEGEFLSSDSREALAILKESISEVRESDSRDAVMLFNLPCSSTVDQSDLVYDEELMEGL